MGLNWDELYQNPEEYDRQTAWVNIDLDFWPKLAKALHARNILELACGNGRVTIPLAKAGFEVTGLDLWAPMLEHGKLKERRLVPPPEHPIEWVQGNMIDFKIADRFDLVVIPFHSLHHLTRRTEFSSLFRCVREHLRPKGYFVVDVFNPLHPGFGIKDVRFSDLPRAMKINRLNDPETIDEILYFFPTELPKYLESHGFKIKEFWGGADQKPFRADSLRMIAVCQLK